MAYEQSYIGGFIGHKGAGKSLSLAQVVVWRLLQGRRVWSNMKIKTSEAIVNRNTFINGNQVKESETEPLNWDLLYMLDESMVDGDVAVDEITYYASSRMSMATRNRLINTCCRQARHRGLSFFYTARKFSWIDAYLRSETDFIVSCEDLSYSGWGRDNNVKGGTVVLQRYYDISGVMTGKSVDLFQPGAKPYKALLFYGSPYFQCYDTHEIISIEEAFTNVKLDLQTRTISNRGDNHIENIKKEMSIASKVSELEDMGKMSLDYTEFNQILRELGLSSTDSTKNKFRDYGLWWENNEQRFVIHPLPPQWDFAE